MEKSIINIKTSVIDFVKGMCMATADSVPGVSGGTIAFLLGFYDQFVTSVHNFLMGSNQERIAALPFLIKLGLGWVIGFSICVLILSSLFEVHIYEICSLFIGLTIFAIPIVAYEEREYIKNNYLHIIFTVIGAVAVFLLFYLNPVSGRSGSIDLGTPTIGLAVLLFIAAIIAVSALVLPGISGSSLLLIFGLYVPLISAVSAFLHMDFQYVPMLIVFGLGMITGLAFIVKVVKVCFERWRSQTIYLAIGLLIGSIYAIIMGPSTLAIPQPAMSLGTFSIPLFILGGVILFGLQYMKMRQSVTST